jgi:hypothetical protein
MREAITMMRSVRENSTKALVLSAIALAALGCAEMDESDNLEAYGSDGVFRQTEQSLAKWDCNDAGDQDELFYGDIDPEHVSPRTYSGDPCYKGYIVELHNADLDAGSPGWRPNVSFGYADTLPTNQTACEELMLRVLVYVGKNSDGSWKTSDFIDRKHRGYWAPAQPPTEPGGIGWPAHCAGPGLTFEYSELPGLSTGEDYRFAVTARTEDTSGAPTRKVNFETDDGGILR